MPSYRVIRPFIDRETGQRREPGEMIEADAERGGRMLAARVVVEIAPESPEKATRAPQETTARSRGRASS